MPSSRLGCPLSLKTPNMGNTGLERYQSTNTGVGIVLSTVSLGTPALVIIYLTQFRGVKQHGHSLNMWSVIER